MTLTVTEVTRLFILSNTYESLSTSLGAIVILLLIVLLIQKELIRARGGLHARKWMRALDIAIAPLLLAFLVIVILRLINLRHPL